MNISSSNDIEKLLAEIHAIRLTDYERTVELAEKALALARQSEDADAIVRSLNYLAWGHNRQNQYSKAVKPAQEALALAQEYGLLEAEGFALSNLSLCYDFSRQREESFRALYRQLEIGEQLGNGELITAAHNDLGAMYHDRHEDERAIRHYEKAVAAAADFGQAAYLAFPLINLARLVYQQGDTARALDLAERCFESARAHHFTSGTAAALGFIANVQISAGDLDAAAATLRRGSDERHDLRLAQAELARARGDYSEAIRLLLKCISSSQCLADEMILIHQKLARLYAEQGDYAEAYRHSQDWAALQDRWHQEEMASRIEVVNVIYELEGLRRELDERKRTEAERLERERAEIALEQQRKLDEIKRELLIRLSHEFRTPLAIMRTSFDLITRYADRLTPEKRDHQIVKIDAQFLQIERLLDNVLDVLRAENLTRTMGAD